MDDLDASWDVLNWALERAVNSGIFAEQVHPDTNAPLTFREANVYSRSQDEEKSWEIIY
jgi:GH15 family glucan-1,4-alpha-glucosidase